MKIITVLSRKGGAGKSIVSQSIAVSAETNGERTMLIDTDPQSTTSKWFKRRKATLGVDTPYVVYSPAEMLDDLINDARDAEADLVVIDTPPHAESSAAAAARFADLVLIPCRPAIADVDAIQASIDIANLSKKPTHVVINAVPSVAGISKRYEELKTALVEGYNLSVLNTYFNQLVAFSDAAITGLVPSEYEKDSRASCQEKLLYKEIEEILLTC